MKDHYKGAGVDLVIGIEARGFIFAPALAYALGAGFVPVRKPKKLPGERTSITYDLEYGSDTLEMHTGAVAAGHRVLIVDDLLATGGNGQRDGAAGRTGRRQSGGTGLRAGIDVPERTPEAQRLRRVLAAAVRQVMAATRRARRRALAKINLDLRVIGKRPDGYHEIRTVFQTISLSDRLDLAFTPQRSTEVELRGNVDIPDNLATRAARLCLDEMRLTGRLEMRLEKKIPMGAGFGGGSSNAAAVLLALPVLAGGAIPVDRLIAIGRELGSDVPFFLLGGRAAGLGRGTELYPLPDLPSRPALVVTPPVHVSTPDAYRSLARGN